MTKELWINLPVKDIKKAKEFYTAIGFKENTNYPSNEQSVSFFASAKNVVIMLFTEAMFQGFTRNKITDTMQSTEVLFSIDAENREEVDELAKKAEAAGGTVYGKPGDNQGWMYGCGFTDPDGHRWNVLFMDMSRMPQR